MIETKYPAKSMWSELLKRPLIASEPLFDTVRQLITKVKDGGDKAVLELEETFDKVQLSSLVVSPEEIQEAENFVSEELKQAILLAKSNIAAFHASQKFPGIQVETTSGVSCWQKSVPIEKVGLYIPGGTAPLFSTVLMLAVPAQIAGCKEIVLCTPPAKNGKVHPAVLYAAKVAGVNKIFKIGGVQAIASMAYGTESVPKVYKIFGPGNQYVTAAKQLVGLHDVAIDMPAGPSEVEVLADETANPVFVAADLLSQAEHGVDSQAMLITTSEALLESVKEEVERQLAVLPRKEIAAKALQNSKLILVNNIEEAVEMTNEYAPEHLIIQTENYLDLSKRIVNAGSIFLGKYACESAGDYASGTNHTLPTNGYAKAYNGVNLDSFSRKLTYQELTVQGIQQIGPAIEVMAANECLDGHKNAVTVRLKSLEQTVSTPASFDLKRLTRPNIWNLQPYSSARDEYKGVEASVFLDANENPYNNPLNRYPDPLQLKVKEKLAKVKGVAVENIFLGNGSDEAIDLPYRCFTRPGIDNVVAMEPTYGMYKVCADINDVEYRKVLLDEDFQITADRLLAVCDENTKIIWICSPNNPTGNNIDPQEVLKVIEQFRGIVIVDEAYSDFSDQQPWRLILNAHPNLIVLNTFSKAWGRAAMRLGMAFASADIIAMFNKVKYPYNVNQLTQREALAALEEVEKVQEWVKDILKERVILMEQFEKLSICEKVYPTDANFFLARVKDANKIYKYLVSEGIIVRNRHKVSLCGNCLRITIGTPKENETLICALQKYNL